MVVLLFFVFLTKQKALLKRATRAESSRVREPWRSASWVLLFNPVVSLCLLIGEFHLFAFRVIPDTGGRAAVSSPVSGSTGLPLLLSPLCFWYLGLGIFQDTFCFLSHALCVCSRFAFCAHHVCINPIMDTIVLFLLVAFSSSLAYMLCPFSSSPFMFHIIPFYVRVCYQIEGSDSYFGASLVAQTVKNLSVMQETQVRSLGQEDPLEEDMATHSSLLACRIPWTEEPDGLQSMGSQKVRHN